jgi:uncharacterized Zn-binding protein involved in type VI secretion
MPKGPAAHVGSPTAHGPPLAGVGSPTVRIRGRPAWRGVAAPGAPALQSAWQAGDTAIKAAEKATLLAAGTPGLPGVKATEEAVKTATAAAMAASVQAAALAGGDVHTCSVPMPPVIHGPGVVVNGSATVRINGMPACRAGDTLVEAIGPPNTISGGESSVQIGG